MNDTRAPCWHHFACQQQPDYANKQQLEETVATLHQLPGLITAKSLAELQTWLAKAGKGEAFILQGGNCAELFTESTTGIIKQKLMMLRQLSLLLTAQLGMPVIGIGRIAGQYAKPRTVLHETRGDVCLPSYRGDLINLPEFNAKAREPDPKRLLLGYQAAEKTMKYIDSYLEDEVNIINDDNFWAQMSIEADKLSAHHAINMTNIRAHIPKTLPPLFTSHEALLLAYETALTRRYEERNYNAGTHFPWIGMRTSSPDSNHITYAANIANPVAVKIGLQVNADDLTELIHRLNPKGIPGKLCFIHRLGNAYIAEQLPALIKAAKKTGIPITWMCDPMHGNTYFTQHDVKTRRFTDIAGELLQAFDIHQAYDSILGGMHIEMTEEHVTECVGSRQELSEVDLTYSYKSLVDPRLNYGQTLELLMVFSEHVLNKRSL